jgi:hypothetical protein
MKRRYFTASLLSSGTPTRLHLIHEEDDVLTLANVLEALEPPAC